MRTMAMRLALAGLAMMLIAGDVLADQADEKYMRQAIELARQAMAAGNDPFGAVLIKDGKVVAVARNTVHTDRNVCHHAETNCLAAAHRIDGLKTTAGSTLYASCEPCAMCCGAIYMSGVKRLVYGLSAERMGAMVGWKEVFPSRAFFRLAKNLITVTGPVLEDEAAKVFEEYLAKMRKKAPPRTK